MSGAGSYTRRLTDIFWTLDELAQTLGLQADEIEAVSDLIRRLKRTRQIMEIPGEDGKPARYVTRVAETVRLLGHGYEYWKRGRPGIEAMRWLVEEKRVPTRKITPEDFIAELKRRVESAVGRGAASDSIFQAIDLVIPAVAASLRADWTKARFSMFQLDAAAETIRSQYAPRRKGQPIHQVLCADVGGGKTVAFVIGVLVSAVEARVSGKESPCHLILYPRTALARDQYKKIGEIASLIRFARPAVLYEHIDFYNGKGLTVKAGVHQFYKEKTPPEIIITTLETLKRRLRNPDWIRAVAPRLKRVVMDEIHLVEGLTGTNIIHVIDRLRQAASNEILWTGSSATVATPELHMAELFGVPASQVSIVWPSPEETEPVGLVHHVFAKPSGAISTFGCLVNATSTLVHLRRSSVGDRAQKITDLSKTIGFADSLDVLGRWNADLRENERTENSPRGRRHPKEGDPAAWGPQEREVPYALRFHNPLTRRMKARAGQPASDGSSRGYGPVLTSPLVTDPCSECRKGQRKWVSDSCSPQELAELGRFVYREPTKDEDRVASFYIQNPAFRSEGNVRIGTMDRCPFLQAGACFWFPEEDAGQEVEPITDDRYEWRNVVRSKVHSSKKREVSNDISDELEELVFRAPVSEVYDERTRDDQLIPVDIVLASPSLEVGIDLSNLTEEIMFKSIRNVAAYRQKAGRAGREEGLDTVILTLLSSRAIDFHYYRQPRKLVRTGHLDPIPLKARNPTLLRSALYQGTWDYLALHAPLPEIIPIGLNSGNGKSEFALMIEQTLGILGREETRILEHLRGISRGFGVERDFKGAIVEVERELRFLLTPTAGVLQNARITCMADMVANFLSTRGQRVALNPQMQPYFDQLRGCEEGLERARPGIDPIELGLHEELLAVDRMRVAGWDRDTLDAIYARITSAIRPDQRHGSLRRYLDELDETKEALAQIERLAPGAKAVVWSFHNQLERTFPADSRGKAYYLSYLIEDLPAFKFRKEDPSFSMPPTLYTNPHEPMVEIVASGDGFERPQGQVSVGEALYGFVPGTWTYRLGRDAFKTKIGSLDRREGRALVANYRNLVGCGHVFKDVRRGIPGPPGSRGTIDVLMPVRISLRKVSKYVDLDPDSLMVADDDEMRSGGRRLPMVKVPQAYPESWMHITSGPSEPILVSNENFENIRIEQPEGELRGEEARRRVVHPLLTGAISGFHWHPELDVVEYMYSVTRTYTSRNADGAELVFQREGQPVAFGRRLTTEGVSMTLNQATVERLAEEARRGILEVAEVWAPTAIKALSAALQSLELDGSQPIDAFTVRDLIALLVGSTANQPEECTFSGLARRLTQLLSNMIEFRSAARRYAEQRSARFRADVEDDARREPLMSGDEDKFVEKMTSVAVAIQPHLGKLGEGIDDWIKTTLLNTLGIMATHALQRLSGTPEARIGYSPDLESIGNRTYRVFLYDRDEHGNGTCELLRKYLHVLYVQRAPSPSGEVRRLPSEDFLTILEQELLQCPQFHVDVNALQIFSERQTGTSQPTGIPELGYVLDHSREVEEIGRGVWQRLGLRGPSDAWRLPLLNRAVDSVAHDVGLQRDDVYRATGICWNGCPECVISDTMLMGGVKGQDYVDKALVDLWFRMGRESAREYEEVSPVDLATGVGPRGIGAKSRLRLDLAAKTYRAVALPFMIGIEVERGALNRGPRLVFREGDFADLELLPDTPAGEGYAFAVGMSRLVWYLLLMSAYLDSLGRIPDERKDVVMVFYDVRDISFDETGMSEKMRATLEALMKEEKSAGSLARLSDILLWMASKGFRIRLCVDEGRAAEEGVRSLLETLSSSRSAGLQILTKNLQPGAMHAKGLSTPLGAVTGSANLTYFGTSVNDELLNYAPAGTALYENLRVAFQDILRGAVRWGP